MQNSLKYKLHSRFTFPRKFSKYSIYWYTYDRACVITFLNITLSLYRRFVRKCKMLAFTNIDFHHSNVEVIYAGRLNGQRLRTYYIIYIEKSRVFISIWFNKFWDSSPFILKGRDYALDIIKEYVFPSLSHFDLIFIVLRWKQARRRVRAGRAEFNAILRLIRTFKAVNEDWPHVPSARPLPPPRPAPSYALPPRVLCIRVCAHDLENVLVPGRTCSRSTYGAARQTYSTLLLLVRGL